MVDKRRFEIGEQAWCGSRDWHEFGFDPFEFGFGSNPKHAGHARSDAALDLATE